MRRVRPRRYAAGTEAVHVYGNANKRGNLFVSRFINHKGKWYQTHKVKMHESAVSMLPNAIHANEANQLGIGHTLPVTSHNEHLSTPLAEEIPESKPDPNKVITPTPPRLAQQPRKPVQLPNRTRPKSPLESQYEDEDRLPYRRRLTRSGRVLQRSRETNL